MEKKNLTAQIPEGLKDALDILSKQTGRNKNVLIAASLHHFLEAETEQQETTIKKYLSDYPK